MKLPNDSVGVTDIQTFRDCPRRFAFGMRRHVEGSDPPEAQHPDTMYGTIFHDTVEAVEKDDLSIDEALQFAFNRFSRFLEPDDLTKIRADLDLYWERQEVGVRTIANEAEVRIPLFVYNGTQIYFRCRIDRLYQRLDNPAVFIHRDFKSSKWAKTEAEVHSDVQMWAYNWAINEQWPEVEYLTQVYDQLRHGEIPTRKSPEQRDQIKEWLIRQITAILEYEPDPPEPTFNEWCPWCPIKYDCKEIERLSTFEAARIKALTPDDEADVKPLSEFTDRLSDVSTAIKTLQAYEKVVKAVVRQLPNDEREAVGFRLQTPNADNFTPDAMERAAEILGPEFFALAKFTKKSLEAYLKDDPRLDEIMALATKTPMTPRMMPIRGD